jgi:hypothetical protein
LASRSPHWFQTCKHMSSGSRNETGKKKKHPACNQLIGEKLTHGKNFPRQE